MEPVTLTTDRLLLRPVGQNAFVKGLILALKRADGALDLAEALRRANKINWASPAGSIWTNTIVAADGRSGVVYVEDAAAVPLAAVPAGASVVAVDARAPYAELPVSPDGGAWEAPHASDWALAFAAP